MRRAGYIERMGADKCAGYWCGILRERNHLQGPGAEGKIILRRIIRSVSHIYSMYRQLYCRFTYIQYASVKIGTLYLGEDW